MPPSSVSSGSVSFGLFDCYSSAATVRLLLYRNAGKYKTQHFTRHECSLLSHFWPCTNVIF